MELQIGKTIRTYRTEKKMTQEEMAARLGVTPSAVNKWENGKSFPDITMLAPIARLLGVRVDTLVSFQDGLAEKEQADVIRELDNRLRTQSFSETFSWAKQLAETYPNNTSLLWQIALTLDAQRLISGEAAAPECDTFILDCYGRALESDDETLQARAADSLFSYYMRQGNFTKAEAYLPYFSAQSPERLLREARLYEKTDRQQQACKAYEQILFSGYQTISMVFQSLYALAMQENDRKRARYFLEKQTRLAQLFEMGTYAEVSPWLDFFAAEKNVGETLDTARQMLGNLHTLSGWTASPLYAHMDFTLRPEFPADLRENLLKCFRDEESFGYMKDCAEWNALIE